MRYLSQLIIRGNLDETTRSTYLNFFRENGKSLWNAATLKPNIIFGPNWMTRPSAPNVSCSVHLSGIMLFELLDELKRLTILHDADAKMIVNAQKAYRYFQLNIISNNGAPDTHFAEWQLFGKQPDPPGVGIISP